MPEEEAECDADDDREPAELADHRRAGPLSNIALFLITAAVLAVQAVRARPWLFHTIFWASGITFIMVFEYVFTRAFVPWTDLDSDFANIGHGLNLSPYVIFIAGTALGLLGLWYIFTVLVPAHYRIVTPGEVPKQYVTIASVSFVFFFIYIGVRINAFPSVPMWWTGIAGIIALFFVPLLVSPVRRWVRERTGE